MTKKVKRISLIMTVVVLVTGVSSIKGAITFKDVPKGIWYEKDLNYILADSRQILVGYPDGTFRPNDKLTVEQFIKCAVVAGGHQVAPNTTNWSKPYIDKAISESYVLYEEFTNYKKSITRAEMAQIIIRVLEDTTGKPNYRNGYEISKLIKDYNTIPNNFFKEAVEKVYDTGIIGGYPDGTFKPNNVLTRAEAIAVLRRLIDPSARLKVTLPSENNNTDSKVEVVEGIKFDNKKDITETGAMKIDKQQEFVDKLFKSIQFYKSGSQNYVKGYLPKVPEGFEWSVNLQVYYKNDVRDHFYAGSNGTRTDIKIYEGKNFQFKLINGKESVKSINISAWIVTNNKNKYEDGRFFLDYPEKTYEKYNGINTIKMSFDWEDLLKW